MEQRLVKNWSKFDKDNLRSTTASILWVNLMQDKQVDSARNIFEEYFNVRQIDAHHIRSGDLPLENIDSLCFELDYPSYDALNMIIVLHRKFPELPILFITLEHSEELALWALRNRMWDYQYKPLDQHQTKAIKMNLLEHMALRDNGHFISAPLGHGSACPKSITQSANNSHRKVINAAVNYVEENYRNKINDAETGKQCGVTCFQFRRIFQKHFNQTFQEYLLNYRIEKAKELLANSHVQISSICFDVGFNDPSYFTRIFKRTVGVTPSVFKANCVAQWNTEKDISVNSLFT